MKCNCGNKYGGTTFLSTYVGTSVDGNREDDYYAKFTCHSCGNHASATGPNQKWAEKALERKWEKLSK